jgi:anti-anti-sigma factor
LVTTPVEIVDRVYLGKGMRTVAQVIPQAFGVERVDVNGAPGVAVRGEIDVAVTTHLEQAVDAAIRDTVGAFVIDLCEVEFIDSSGLGVILRARSVLARDGRALAIVCVPGSVRRLFDAAGVADLLFLYGSREAVAADLVRAA